MGMINGRAAVVTGAGRGIGRAIAETLAREGANVCINDVDETPAKEAAEAITKAGGTAIICCGDIRDSKFTDKLMLETNSKLGSVDILVNNAGITRDNMIHKMSDEDWDFVIDVNLKGTFNCIRSSTPYIRDAAKRELDTEGRVRHHRKIVNFYSTAAIKGNIGQTNYTAAKMGNVGITRTIAREWGRFGVCVNAVAPGLTMTRMTKAKEKGSNMGIPQDQLDAMVKEIPFGRAGEPQDIANVVLFFCSPLSDFVTGQQVNVSGGMVIGG